MNARSVAVPAHWLDRFQEAYVAELAQWAHSLQGEQPFAGANAWDGYAALLVTDACVQSLHNHLPVVVQMPVHPPLYGSNA